jgi:hypothetical protein
MKPGLARRHSMRAIGLILLGLSLWAGIRDAAGAGPNVAGDEVEAAFDEANRLYEQGDYAAAAAAYERLLGAAPGTASLHYNLGNAWFKAGEVGLAIWHYRAARDFSPRDADIRANLQFARNQVGASEQVGEGRLGRWVGLLTLDEWGLVSVALFWCGMAGVVVARLRPGNRGSIRFWARLLMVAWLGSVLALGWVWHGQRGQRVAVVVAEGGIRYGPFEESQIQFTVPGGAELRVLDTREGWVRVEHARRGSGWIERSRVRIYPGS